MSLEPRPHGEIRRLAEELLHRCGCEEDAPVDVDEIAEYDLKIRIETRVGLHANRGVEGAISHDLTKIYLDNSLIERPRRWKSTVAHEIAHSILHGEFISSLPCDDDRTLIEAIVSISDADIDVFESEAQIFADALLVPDASLRRIHGEQVEALKRFSRHFGQLSEKSKEAIAGKISDSFEVSTKAVERRLRLLGLEGWQPEPDDPRLIEGFHRQE